MAASLTDLLSAMQNGVQAIQGVVTALGKVFPQAGSTTITAPSGGTIAFTSSEASLFQLVTTSSGGTYKVALYPST